LGERLVEAVAALASIPGVLGLIVGGSVGRGEPWPMSDIDVIPVVADAGANLRVQAEQAALVDWWTASGRAQGLDTGTLFFTGEEVRRLGMTGGSGAAALMQEPRWRHGLDKAYGGYADADDGGFAGLLVSLATAVRFDPVVREARAEAAQLEARRFYDLAVEASAVGDTTAATLQLRQAARAFRLLLIEHWEERLGSLGREWTRFEQMAERHDAADTAATLASIAGATVAECVQRSTLVPRSLGERIRLARAARSLIGEEVSDAENTRDQIAAFSVLVQSRDVARDCGWLGLPDPQLREKLAAMDALLSAAGHD
jgi:hypothetical protein